jgi:hypothetical protein
LTQCPDGYCPDCWASNCAYLLSSSFSCSHVRSGQ